MSKYSLASMLCMVILISGCDHYTTKMAMMEQSNAHISSISPASGGEMTFSGYLAAQYYQLASYEQNVTRDYPAAKNYFTKAEALSKGRMVTLNQVSDYQIGAAEKAELIEAAQQIEYALQEYRIPENRYPLALAHSRYDCWLDEAEEGKEKSTCKGEYKQAMNALIEPYTYYSEDDYFNDVFDLGL